MFKEEFVPQGWQCPVCKQVYAPHIDMCHYCGTIDLIGKDYIEKSPTIMDNPHKFPEVICSEPKFRIPRG